MQMIRVAIVEDDENYISTLKEYIARFTREKEISIRTEVFRNGEKLLFQYDSRFDIILMDIEMPQMDGYEATLRIRKLPNRIRANTPIVAFTANAVAENRDRAFAVGMDGFLVKPVNTARLLSCLAKLL